MATAAGLLGTPVNSASAGTAVLYTCPDGCKAHVTVSLCNNGTATTKGRAGFGRGAATAPTGAEWVLGGLVGKAIPPGETIQVTLTLGPGQKACAGYDAALVAATCQGL